MKSPSRPKLRLVPDAREVKTKSKHSVRDAMVDPDDDSDEASNSALKSERKRRPRIAPPDEPYAMMRMSWIPEIVRKRAWAALPLLWAIAYQIGLSRGESRVPITSRTWMLAGGPYAKEQRRWMLQVLQRIPDIVQLEFSLHTGVKYAAHKGPKWDEPFYVPTDSDDYRGYLLSAKWQVRRKRRLEVAGHRCEHMTGSERCDATRGLEVHHLHYDSLGSEADADLEVLCRHHHLLAHSGS
jgi:hypothetical protein